MEIQDVPYAPKLSETIELRERKTNFYGCLKSVHETHRDSCHTAYPADCVEMQQGSNAFHAAPAHPYASKDSKHMS